MTICKMCREDKPDSLFVTVRSKRVGLVCRACRNLQLRTVKDRAEQTEARRRMKAAGEMWCQKCEAIKLDTDFPQFNGARHGRVCRACTASYKTELYLRSPDAAEVKAKREARRQRKAALPGPRQACRDPLARIPCRQCNVEKPAAEFYSYDGVVFGKMCCACHVERGQKRRIESLAADPKGHRAKRANEAVTRRAGVAHRVPDWADPFVIQDFYDHCPEGHHVDHVVPLFGKLVSGFHVHNNLQYLPAKDNMRKNARFDPETFE